MSNETPRTPILAGLRVLDIGLQYAAANCAGILADLGAEVVAVEHPEGSPIRTMAPKKDGHSMWWKSIQRNKTHISLNLSKPEGRTILLGMVKDFDVIVENFRPGTLERWGLGPQDLERAGANAALVRISGYGQTGPYSERPAFGTAAEAMSGFAQLNGHPDDAPTFPSVALADGVASLWAVIGALACRVDRLAHSGRRGVEVVDVALFEGLFRIIPNQVATYQQTGVVPRRPGNYLGDHGVLRNVYRSRDGRYLIVAAAADAPIRCILVGAAAESLVRELDGGAMHDSELGKVRNFLDRCNAHLMGWAATHDCDRLSADLSAAGAVFNTVYDVSDIFQDPHYQAREDLVTVQDPELGPLTIQGVVPKFPQRDHRVRHAGGSIGQDNAAFYAGRGLGQEDLARLKREGVI